MSNSNQLMVYNTESNDRIDVRTKHCDGVNYTIVFNIESNSSFL